MKKWNFGIVGAGMIANFHAKAIQSLPNANLAGICSDVPEQTRLVAEKYNCKAFGSNEEMLSSPDIDIVTIATPSGVHMEPAIMAAQYGKHTIVEKPVEITLDRIDQMIAAHKAAGTQLGAVFNFRFNDAVQLLKQTVEAGRFGKISHASVQVPWWRKPEYYAGSWRGTWKMDGGGALMNQSIHMVDMLQYLMGPLASLQAYTATIAHEIEVEDTATAVVQFKNNALGAIYGSTASFPGQLRRIEITGTKGTAVLVENSFSVWDFADQTEEDNAVLTRFQNETTGGASDPSAIPFEPHAKNFAAFIAALDENRPFEIDGTEARKAVEIILAVYQSAKEKKMYTF
ncbi:Gfo/Idh/MocA family protein [Adhaeribacter rhizoryzae]|uniref:Gfo/Idh/MocA family oxidoreductase n=1 Tax=Adhaeribacter rhizoryzae TaxID=2607907 RepID=A0A5M6D973_9BACT|nr:Gfo/Idh/MocA family oxidoreductase [Adhaeribacter rhizoryzae]KAA5544061.1 Gfo/Idh/MocA family oxidoreductase [Adhaeribacter rhizoryzae]